MKTQMQTRTHTSIATAVQDVQKDKDADTDADTDSRHNQCLRCPPDVRAVCVAQTIAKQMKINQTDTSEGPKIVQTRIRYRHKCRHRCRHGRTHTL